MNTISINVDQGGCMDTPLLIGYAGENNIDAVDFDFSAWVTDYGEGVIYLEIMRAKDTAPYLAILAVDGTVARWTISDVDTAKHGPGVAQLVYQPTGATKKSAIYKFFVGKSLTEPGGDDPWEPIIERMEEILAEVKEQAAAADQSAKDAEAWAVGERGGEPVPQDDPAHENNAKYYVDTASETVRTFTETTAPAAVQAVNTAGQTALTAVSGAQTAAVNAITQKSTEEQAAIQQKGQEVLESIPADYTELSEDVDNLKDTITRNSFPLITGFAVRVTNGFITTVNSANWDFVAIHVEPGIDFDITTKIYGSTYYDVLIADITGKVIAQHQTAGSNTEVIVNYTGTIADKNARIIYINTRTGYTPKIILKTNAGAITTAINRTQNTSITIGCVNCGAYKYPLDEASKKPDTEYLENWKLMLESCNFDVFNLEDSMFTGLFTQSNIYDPVIISAHHSQQNDIHTESRIEVIDATYVTLPSTVTVEGVTYTTERYRGLCCRCMMGDKSVGVYAVHLAPAPGKEPMRKAQFEALIADAARFDEVIFTGDFNCQTIDEYEVFTDAGYTLGNGGYFGTFLTLREIPADNIIVSDGLIITSFRAITDYELNTDHSPIVAKIQLKA